MRAPRGEPDDVAVGAERGLGQLDQARAVEELQPERIAIEDAQIAIHESAAPGNAVSAMHFVPVNRRERVDFLARFLAELRGNRVRHERVAVVPERCEHSFCFVNGVTPHRARFNSLR